MYSIYTMVFRKKTTTTIKKTVVRKRTTRPKKSALVTKTQLYRAIRRNIETKMASIEYGMTSFNSGITANADYIAILPSIAQGTGQNARIGNEIKPLKLVIRGHIIYDTLDANLLADARMLGARLFCFQDKATKTYNNNIYNFQLLDDGGSSVTFTGTAINFITPHNSQQFKFFADRKYKILKPFGTTNDTTPASTSSIMSMNTTMYHPFVITITQKQLPAILKYDMTDSINNPVNFCPMLALGYADLLNSAADTTTTQLKMQFVSTLTYEDA